MVAERDPSWAPLSSLMWVLSSADSWVEVSALTWAPLRACNWVWSNTTLVWMLAICGPFSPLTWVAESAPIWVESSAAMPLVAMAPTCVALNDWISVVVSAAMVVTGRAAIWAGERLEMGIRSS